MPDSMDRTQEHVLRMQQEQLDRIERDRANQVAREACAECHEPISKLRQGMGARLCMECQTAHEGGMQ